jgi:predicted metalloprotease
MDLNGQRSSGNVEDRRGMGMVGGGLGIGGLIIAVIAMFMGVDPSVVLNGATETAPVSREQQQAGPQGAPADEGGQFVSKVLGSTEDVWTEIFRASGQRYPAPKLVLFSGATRTYCGMGQAAMGPFYCPRDQSLYIDLTFYRELQTRFRAPGDFAQAYVIAHEVGHHIQNVTGTMDKLEAARARGSKAEGNQMSVRVELQADCYAGVWAHHASSSIKMDASDMEEGLNAAAAIGDDRLQKQTQGRVVPEAFTHGSSAQRVRWFRKGMESGRVGDCDTFGARTP